ncbi:trehalose-phosphatase [Streptomyces sp. NPDC059697]|uniref:trehalose-phosphatase n=1 Tax=Streptomyces sp. NPDC059697 TaxID=3346912 RepID=UPI00367999DF
MSASRYLSGRLAADAMLQSITQEGRDGLTDLVEDPQQAVLALDFDGTLADIVDDPHKARLRPGADSALSRLARHVGHVVIVTGRPLRDLTGAQGLFPASLLKQLHLIGHYGAELRDPATAKQYIPAPPLALQEVREVLPRLLTQYEADAGVRVEDKGAALAVHTRRAAHPQAAFHQLWPVLLQLAGQYGLKAEPGRLVIELLAAGQDKGGALTGFLTQRQARTVLYAGDDLADIPAFDAVARHRSAGGSGTLLYSAPASADEAIPDLARRADLTVDGPRCITRLLLQLADALDSG